MERLSVFITLLLAMLIVGALVSISMFIYGRIPLLGELPGDNVYLLPAGELFLPVTSCIVVSLVLTGLAYVVTRTPKK
jgi:hypothetical protein